MHFAGRERAGRKLFASHFKKKNKPTHKAFSPCCYEERVKAIWLPGLQPLWRSSQRQVVPVWAVVALLANTDLLDVRPWDPWRPPRGGDPWWGHGLRAGPHLAPSEGTWHWLQPTAVQGLAFTLQLFAFLFAFLKAQVTFHLWQSWFTDLQGRSNCPPVIFCLFLWRTSPSCWGLQPGG